MPKLRYQTEPYLQGSDLQEGKSGGGLSTIPGNDQKRLEQG